MRKTSLMLALLLGLLYLPATNPGYAQSSPNQATVIFHRADNFAGKAVRFNISQNGQSLGQLLAGTQIVRSLDPGTYTFVASSTSLDGIDQLTLKVEAGVTYRIEGKVLMGWPVGRAKFGSVSESGAPTRSTSPPASATKAATPHSGPAGNPSGSQNFEAASLGLKGFRGQWQMQMWSLTADGVKLHGEGSVSGIQDDANSIRLVVNELSAAHIPNAIGGGEVVIAVHPELGLTLTSKLPASDSDLNFAGQYRNGRYVFYLIGGSGETMTGVDRSSMRLEFAAEGVGTWVAESYITVDGQTSIIQSARFTRSR
ncbi:MAG: hypothetical protein ACR2QS_13055 [Woeseiaceae bacterium]